MADDMSAHIRRGTRVFAVGGKAQYHSFSMTAADMQALETRKFTVRELCRLRGMSPPSTPFMPMEARASLTVMVPVWILFSV